jgi:hypothetical protein
MANPITYHDMTPAIGAKVSVKFEDIRVPCTVRNVKNSYGRVRLEVVPESGSGSQWVEVSRLTKIPDNGKSEATALVPTAQV